MQVLRKTHYLLDHSVDAIGWVHDHVTYFVSVGLVIVPRVLGILDSRRDAISAKRAYQSQQAGQCKKSSMSLIYVRRKEKLQ